MKESMMDPNSQLSLSWDAYEKSICSGLGLLQQRGEFVDMTLAAEGHHVKVHQMVMSLVSPFIKDLISSASCPHPVIFLNRVSYTTLQSLLEYAYTGEVLIAPNGLVDFLEACKDLHIKGLQDITIQGDGKDLLHLIGVKTAEKDDPLELSEKSQVASPSRSGIKRRRMAKAEETVQYIHPQNETLDDDHIDETQVDEYDNEITYEETLDDDCDETYDDNKSQDMKHEDTTDIKYLCDNGAEEECEEIESYKAGSKWLRRGEYFYVVQRTKGRTAYLRCGSDKCPAQWKLHMTKGAGPVINAHNHLPTPWVPNRNLMFQALRRRTTTESIPLHVIYEQEASRYADAAPYLPYESVAPSMRKWRRTTKAALTRTIQSMG